MTKTTKKTLLNPDRINNADQGQVAALTVGLFDSLQRNPVREHRLVALACAFVLLSRAARVNAQDVFTAATNLMVDETTSERMTPQFAAMAFHLEEDLVRR